ncbi:hypothetical protein SUDANB70_00264 [Streptomyces sp. enrichment culture]
MSLLTSMYRRTWASSHAGCPAQAPPGAGHPAAPVRRTAARDRAARDTWHGALGTWRSAGGGPGARRTGQVPGLRPYTYTSSPFFSSDQYFFASAFVMLTQPREPGGFHMLTAAEWKACPPSKNWL